MDIPLPPELMDPDLSNASDGTGAATVASVGLYTNGRYETLAGSDYGGGDGPSGHLSHSGSTGPNSDNTNNTTNASAPGDIFGDNSVLSSNISVPVPSPTPSLPKEPELVKPAELKKLWKPVQTNPSDFNAWTVLLSYVEQQELIVFIREAYDAFFERYPYCYGYWKKYTEMEKRFGSPEQSETVLEQAVIAIPLSIDLWTYYIDIVKERHKGVAGEGRIRELFERAIGAVGLDFKSDELWDAYISWEKGIGQMKNIFGIYERLLRIPTANYQRHFEGLQTLLLQFPVQELITSDEAELLKPHVPEGEDVETVLRQLVVESRRTIFKTTEAEVAKRWTFEDGIKRPYFHVKPLESSQIKNWHDYLDFEIAEKQSNRIIFLFERCLVACALYEEFWRKYLDYLKSETLVDYIRYAYQRVCTYHLINRTGLHLEWAAFEEAEGNMAGALQALQNALKRQPNKAILTLRQIGVTRRMQMDTANLDSAFEAALQATTDTGLGEFFLIKQARFHLKVKSNKERAIEIIRTGLKSNPTSNALLCALIDCELQQIPLDVTAVIRIFDEILANTELSLDQKLDFLERKIHHLEDFSSDIREIRAAHQQYYELTGQTPRSNGRKRAFGEDEDEPMEPTSQPKRPPFDHPPPHVMPVGPPYGMPPAGVLPPPMMAWPPAPPHNSHMGGPFPGYGPPQWPAQPYGHGWPPYQATPS